MRLSQFFGTSRPESDNEASGVTIDLLTGVVAGLALVLAILVLSSSVRHASMNSASPPILADTRG
jgi:hypothetical protein